MKKSQTPEGRHCLYKISLLTFKVINITPPFPKSPMMETNKKMDGNTAVSKTDEVVSLFISFTK